MRCCKNFPWSKRALNVDTAGLYFVCCLGLKKRTFNSMLKSSTAKKSTYLACTFQIALNREFSTENEYRCFIKENPHLIVSRLEFNT